MMILESTLRTHLIKLLERNRKRLKEAQSNVIALPKPLFIEEPLFIEGQIALLLILIDTIPALIQKPGLGPQSIRVKVDEPPEGLLMEPFGCYGLKVVVHGPDCEDKQAKYLVHGWDDVYWVETIDEVLAVIRQDLERETDAGKADPRYMLSQIERLTWEGHQLRGALIASGANMDEVKEMTNNEAWMAQKKGVS